MRFGRAELERYHRDGFVALEGFVDAATCDALRARMDGALAKLRPSRGAHRVRRCRPEPRPGRWFLDSGDKVRFFFEPGAFDDAGALRQPKELSINKVGHALHDLDPVFAAFSRDHRFAELARCSRAGPAAAAAVDVHLQAAAHRRRGVLPPGQHLPSYGAHELHRLLAGPGRRHRDQRLHVGTARRPSRPLHRASCARGGPAMETLDPEPLPVDGLTAAVCGEGHPDPAARSAAAPQRPQSLRPFPPRLLPAPDRRRLPLQPGQLAAARPRSAAPRLLSGQAHNGSARRRLPATYSVSRWPVARRSR